MVFQRNVWYVAALPDQVDRQPRRRVILNEPVLLYRAESGGIVGIEDRCPHRFAPLSRGTLHGDIVECKYHGLRFDRAGHCVLNPHDSKISPRVRINSYPTEERYGLVWIWMGNPALAKTEDIPDLSYMEAPGTRTVHSYIAAPYRYDILVDNLLDGSHIEYLHVGSFSGGASGESTTRVHETGNDVFVMRTQLNSLPPPFFKGPADRVDQSFESHWRPGQVMNFEIRVAPAGTDMSVGFRHRVGHIATPETTATTHYFMSTTRDYAIGDASVDAQVAMRQVTVVQNEDGPMLEAIAAEMQGMELLDMRPVVLPCDAGAMRVRRVMQRLIRAESGNPDSDISGP